MEINKKTNQINDVGQQHGYWEESYHPGHVHQINHYCKGNRIGFQKRLKFSMEIWWLCHFINDREIGCELMKEIQYFYKTPGLKFGEQIEWK